MQKEIALESNPALDFFWEPARTKIAYGGRGGGKSMGIARILIMKALESKIRILCARELQASINDSVHAMLKDQITELGLDDYFTVHKTSITAVNGSEFVFAGLRFNSSHIKSIHKIMICWVEEAETVSEQSWVDLIPSIREEGSEIWISFNPREASDPTYKRFVTNTPPGAIAVEMGWQDNIWFPETLAREKDYAYRTDPEAAEHIWGGRTRTLSKAQVLHGKYIVEAFEPDERTWNGPYQGIDFGFSQDPSCLVRCWVFEQKLYIEHETYGVGVDNDELPALFDAVPGACNYVSRADSARPETISHLRNHGYRRVTSVKKYPGSVEDGVTHLRGYEQIIIHPRCKKALEEATLWSWKKDKLTGDILPILVDKHNHLMDALRYALQPMIKRRKTNVSVSRVVKPLVVASRFRV